MNKMNRKNNGLSTIITTLIIVTASVVLGTAVILFASGIFSSTVQEEALSVSGLKLWGNTTVNSQLGLIVRNIGSQELALESIKVRGTETPFANWFTFDTSTNATINAQTVLEYQGSPTGTVPVLADGVIMAGYNHTTFAVATGPVGLKPGDTVVIFVLAPANINSQDAGLDVTIEVNSREATAVIRTGVSSP